MRRVAVCVCVLMLGLAAFANAAKIIPVSYTAPPGDPSWSWWYYDDSTGSELTDGVHGPHWRNEPGYPGDNLDFWKMPEWVAWDSRPVSIVFQLPTSCILTGVSVFSGRDTIPSIYIPQTVALLAPDAGGNWSSVASRNYVDSEFGDGARHTLSVPLNSIAITSIRIDLTPTQRWVFVDEIEFFGDTVPEPSSILALLIGLGGAAEWVRRGKHGRS